MVEFGLRLVSGDFGSGKTFNVFQDAFIWKLQNPNGLLIANVPYDFVDVAFSKKNDLDDILLWLGNYIAETNSLTDLKDSDFPAIRLIIDEAHIYFFAREYRGFSKDFLLILTQCRKRNISIDIITQRLSQIDSFIRRLCGICTWYENFFLGFRKVIYYDIGDGEKIDRGSWDKLFTDWQFPKKFLLHINKSLKKYYDQKFYTNYVVGLNRLFYPDEKDKPKKDDVAPPSPQKIEEYQKFRALLQQKAIDENKPISKNFDDYSELGSFTSKSLDV